MKMHVHRAPTVPISLALSGRNHKIVKGNGITMMDIIVILGIIVFVVAISALIVLFMEKVDGYIRKPKGSKR